MKNTVIRKNGTRRVFTDYSQYKSKTDKSFAKDCDVNIIMNRFLKTGQISHLSKSQGSYADVSEVPDLSEALNTVTKAQEAFDALPSNIRKRFGNSPVSMVEFISDPKNYKEAADLGLLTIKSSPNLAPTSSGETAGRHSTKQSSKSSPKSSKGSSNDESNDES